ncbi:hypothetical protein D6C78_09763 [Aureobasidium pullulans]|uniref:Altered inheritance of mitochondria protein 9, mitochondrial n=1 Tax=Aureobasidium pullulans TaxID=5580 RepID=A0A4T0B8B6_AURPU|nr:hypothetical protein D6C78_09763 [Aureobasidium pullulans]
MLDTSTLISRRSAERCSKRVQALRVFTSVQKKEGGFNKAFLFSTDDGQRVVTRFPTQVSGPARLITNSEVATMRYRKQRQYACTTIPIPRVIDWSDDSCNPLGQEYIIMEYTYGVQLNELWNDLSSSTQIRCIESLCYYVQQMARSDFPLYGSLYTADCSIPGIETVGIGEGFSIGPHCGTMYWDCTVDESRYYHLSRPNRGPYQGHDLESYSAGLVDTGLTRIPPSEIDNNRVTPFQGLVKDHIDMLARSREVLAVLDQKKLASNLAPPRFALETDPTKITGIIDWQSTSIEPAFKYADTIPDFVANHSVTTSPPSESGMDTTEMTKSEICAVTFDACIKGLVPRLEYARALDADLLRSFRYTHRTWKDGIAALREEFTMLSSRWSELGLPQ